MIDNLMALVKEKSENPILYLIGNKSDLADIRTVSSDDGYKKAEEIGATYIETSAKTGGNVVSLMKLLANKLLSKPEP